jgi:hypothetical protein
MSVKKRVIWITVFAIAMAFVEAAVVVCLRLNYYPEGFKFPIELISGTPAISELLREIATIAMLIAVSILTGRKFQDRFAYFIYAFGIWDIFYYVWLRIILGWPESLLTWDLLFLLPVPWIGPVIAPVVVSISFIIAAVVTLYLGEKGIPIHLNKLKWILIIVAGLIVFISFTWDFNIVLEEKEPAIFHWGLFTLGMVLGWGVFISECLRVKGKKSNVVISN